MNHQHLPTQFLLKDATKDLFKNLWKYVNKKDGTAKCAICGKTIAVPEYETPYKLITRFHFISFFIAVISALIGYGLRYLIFSIGNYDIIDSVWGWAVGVGVGTLMLAASYFIRRLAICRHWVYNEWTEVDLTCETKAELEKNFRPYRGALAPGWHIIMMVLIFYEGFTLSL